MTEKVLPLGMKTPTVGGEGRLPRRPCLVKWDEVEAVLPDYDGCAKSQLGTGVYDQGWVGNPGVVSASGRRLPIKVGGARIPAGGATAEHYHPAAEEIYYITHGTGRIRIGGEEHEVGVGDAIAIPPRAAPTVEHRRGHLAVLCCCAPGYENEDTVLTEDE